MSNTKPQTKPICPESHRQLRECIRTLSKVARKDNADWVAQTSPEPETKPIPVDAGGAVYHSQSRRSSPEADISRLAADEAAYVDEYDVYVSCKDQASTLLDELLDTDVLRTAVVRVYTEIHGENERHYPDVVSVSSTPSDTKRAVVQSFVRQFLEESPNTEGQIPLAELCLQIRLWSQNTTGEPGPDQTWIGRLIGETDLEIRMDDTHTKHVVSHTLTTSSDSQ